jgi:hypothetical protein
MLDHYLWTMPLGRVIAWTPLTLLGGSDLARRGQHTAYHGVVTPQVDDAASKP